MIHESAEFVQRLSVVQLRPKCKMEVLVATLIGVNRSLKRTDPKTNVRRGELRPGFGLVGDAHAGLNEREISLLDFRYVEALNAEHGLDAGPGAFAENLTTQGLETEGLRIGDRLRVGETLLEVVQIGKPLSAAHTYNFKGHSILPKVGIFLRVVRGGIVQVGDEVERIEAEA